MSQASVVLLWARLLSHLDSREAWTVQRAYHLALLVHEGQFRDGSGLPYMTHPLRVALILAAELNLIEPPLLCVALLHDTLEDTDLAAEEIRRACGDTVMEAVLRLTKPPARDDEKEDRDAAYYEGIAGSSTMVQLVKCADRLDNLRSMRELSHPERLTRYIAETRRYLLPIAERCNQQLHEALLEQCEAELLSSVGP